MICSTCLNGCDHGAQCAGERCLATIGACCAEADGLCLECRAFVLPIRCDDLTADLQAILWAGVQRPGPSGGVR